MSKQNILHRNKRIYIYLLALGITLAQCSIVFAEYNHPFHQPDSKCSVCLVAGHLAHALANAGLTLNIDRYVPLQSNTSKVFLVIPFSFRYLIRGPPLTLA
jgi:hypothetical protein